MIVPVSSRLLKYIPRFLITNPFELLISVMCILGSLPYIFSRLPNSSLEVLLPLWLVKIWGVTLLGGGILVTFGIIRYNRYLERAGLSLLGPSAIVYATTLVVVLQVRSLVAAFIIYAFGFACLIRDFTIKVATKPIVKLFNDGS